MFSFIPYTVEDKTSANAYITVSELKDITTWQRDLNDITIDLEDSELETLIVNATSILDNMFKIKDSKKDITQRLEFPRLIEPNEEINDVVKVFTTYLVHQILLDSSIFYGSYEDSLTSEIKSETIGPISTEYYEKNTDNIRSINGIESKINSYYYSIIKSFLIEKRSTSSFMLDVTRG